MNNDINSINQKLNYIISSSNLPIGVVYLIVKNIYYEIEKAYNDFLEYEKIQEEKNNKNESNEFLEKEENNDDKLNEPLKEKEEIEPIHISKIEKNEVSENEE